MNLLRNLPLKRKLTLITMVTSCLALLLTCGVILGFEWIISRQTMVKQVLTTTKIIGDNSAAALTFEDPRSAEQTLQSLSANAHIVAAFIYDARGRPFAHYQPAGAALVKPPPLHSNIHRFTSGYLEVFQEIKIAGEYIGTVYMRHDLLELGDSLQRSGYIIIGVLVAASLLALLLTHKLLPLVTGPILDLADLVRGVAIHQDFSVRAVKQGKDEIGRLIDGFNEMLGEIQQRDTALESARNELEKRIEERTHQLAASLSLLNATLDSTADGILATKFSGELVTFNTQLATMWKIPPNSLESWGSAERRQFFVSQVRDPRQFVERILESEKYPEKEMFDIIELSDGRTFERYRKPQRIDGVTVGVVINFRDITERKRSEAELESVYKQLLETSRRAGMAEVATSVLHNVGNVLNSVNISTGLVITSVKNSKGASLARVLVLLREHAADLGEFLTNDSGGKHVLAHLSQISDNLLSDQESIIRELDSLQRNVEHIKEIVAMQQNFATFGGVKESVNLVDLVEDSLRINQEGFGRHRVEVVREFEVVPLLNTEKHKIMQILVNLLRNAKHSFQDMDRTDKRVTVRVAPGADGVKISITDNGVGIPPENLTRIFNHGFTTRKHGHGFGLHSGALTAREMGGSLTVHSDGVGQGATFTLELPNNTNENSDG